MSELFLLEVCLFTISTYYAMGKFRRTLDIFLICPNK